MFRTLRLFVYKLQITFLIGVTAALQSTVFEYLPELWHCASKHLKIPIDGAA